MLPVTAPHTVTQIPLADILRGMVHERKCLNQPAYKRLKPCPWLQSVWFVLSKLQVTETNVSQLKKRKATSGFRGIPPAPDAQDLRDWASLRLCPAPRGGDPQGPNSQPLEVTLAPSLVLEPSSWEDPWPVRAGAFLFPRTSQRGVQSSRR